MISGEVSTLPSPPSLDRCLITAQVEGTTLTRRQYNNISSLASSMFYLPTGHTLNPLSSTGLLSEMAHEGINKITARTTRQIIIPNTIVTHLILIIMLLKIYIF